MGSGAPVESSVIVRAARCMMQKCRVIMKSHLDRFKNSGVRKGARNIKGNTALSIRFYSCFEKDVKGIMGLEKATQTKKVMLFTPTLRGVR